MKICFPVESDSGVESIVYGHFGSAPFFIIFDTESEEIESINNQDLGHVHGMCNPLKALNGKAVDAIIVGGIGAGAVSKLNNMGVKVYKAAVGTVARNIDFFKNDHMREITTSHACPGHSHNGGGCSH